VAIVDDLTGADLFGVDLSTTLLPKGFRRRKLQEERLEPFLIARRWYSFCFDVEPLAEESFS